MKLSDYLAHVFRARSPMDAREILSRGAADDHEVTAEDVAEQQRRIGDIKPRCATARMYDGWLAGVAARKAAD